MMLQAGTLFAKHHSRFHIGIFDSRSKALGERPIIRRKERPQRILMLMQYAEFD